MTLRALLRPLAPGLLAFACATAGAGGGSAGADPAAPTAGPPPTPVRAVPAPGVRLQEATVLYAVRGRTVAELAAALDAGAPRIDGRLFRGTTDWNVRWRFRWEPVAGGCRLTDVDVRLDVTTTLPRWDPPDDPDPGVPGLWTRYRTALADHEATHRDLAVEAANRVAWTLGGLRAATCAEIEDAANARARTVVGRYRDLNRRFDRETDHGRTRGAAWPPVEPLQENE